KLSQFALHEVARFVSLLFQCPVCRQLLCIMEAKTAGNLFDGDFTVADWVPCRSDERYDQQRRGNSPMKDPKREHNALSSGRVAGGEFLCRSAGAAVFLPLAEQEAGAPDLRLAPSPQAGGGRRLRAAAPTGKLHLPFWSDVANWNLPAYFPTIQAG